jgi:hypothetical protein
MNQAVRMACAFVFLLICYVAWGVVALDYSDRAASGTYFLSQNDDTSTLVLKPDHTFQQELSQSGKLPHASGTWRRFGQGGVAFSRDLLALSGQEIRGNGIAYAQMQKRLGLFTSLVLRGYYPVWYGRVEPSPEKTASGTYGGAQEGALETLVLNPNHTFEQTIARNDMVWTRHANGSWNLNQSGDIVFSREFLKPSGEALGENETSSASDPKGANNLQIQIATAFKSGGPPIYRKRLLPW